ncbi:MAG TPA: hypothetical protein VFF67_04430 [Thermoplasmata archaeon]|nr:hypothetical protein [Thermoplasmata archaeon]
MPGIGKADYPELVPSKAFDIIERVGRENVKTASGLAAVMGLKSPDSGYFYHQVSSLTKFYGLIDRAKGTVALTPLGERIAHPLSDEDKRKAEGEAVRRVALLSSLFERLGLEFHESDFRTTLRDVTQAPLADIERYAGEVDALYKDAQRYLSPSPAGRNGPHGASPTRTPSGIEPSEQRSDSGGSPTLAHEPGYRVFQGDGVYLKIKKDKDSLEEALTTIQSWLKRHTTAE